MKIRHWDRIGNGGLNFTELGFGTAPLGNLYRAVSDEEAQATLEAAWDAGRAATSTRRRSTGSAFRRRGSTASCAASRATTTCSPPRSAACCGSARPSSAPASASSSTRRRAARSTTTAMTASCARSRRRSSGSGVDRIDILFAHDVDIFTHGSQGGVGRAHRGIHGLGYYALLSLRDQGVIKAFGGGINEWQVAQTLAERGDFDLFLLAGRYTLLEQEALDSFLPLCEKRGIGIVLGGPYNSGILATGPKPGAYYNYREAPQEILDRVARIEAVCERHGVTLIEAALHFPSLHPSVVSVIPGGQRPRRSRATARFSTPKIPPALCGATSRPRA